MVHGVVIAPSNVMLSAFGPILDTPFGTAGDLALVSDPSTRTAIPMPDCRIEAITPDGPTLLHIAAHGTRPGGRCPDCGRASRAVHSRYRRHPG